MRMYLLGRGWIAGVVWGMILFKCTSLHRAGVIEQREEGVLRAYIVIMSSSSTSS